MACRLAHCMLALALAHAAAAAMPQEAVCADSLRAAAMAEEMAMNAPGTQAADFAMRLADGSEVSLRGFRGAPLLLVLFDPDCGHCAQALAELPAVLPRELPVLAVYADGDAALWPRAMAAVPDGWTAALDTEGVYAGGLYSPEFSPGLYLLDSAGCVVARGSSAADIRAALIDNRMY